MHSFWERIATLLGDRTDSWLAGQIGVGRSTYFAWKSYGRFPKGDKIIRMAQVLGVSPEALLGLDVGDVGQNEKTWPDAWTSSWFERNKEFLAALQKLDEATPGALDEVKRFVEFRFQGLSEKKAGK